MTSAPLEVYSATAVPTRRLGMWIFLASEIMLFATAFASYIVYRISNPPWPRGWEVLNVPLGTLNTFILIASSVTMVFAYAKTIEKNKAQFRLFLGATILMGMAFLVIKSLEYSDKFAHHHFPSTGIFYAVYFTLTGLHAIHVTIGILVNLYFFVFCGNFEELIFEERMECAGLYWHFVDIVWIFLFPSIYLL